MTALSRRTLLSAVSISGIAAAMPATAQQAGAAAFSAEELAIAGPLGDKILGNALAPVTIIEYASMTCSHCASFHQNGFKFLKERYIDSGKVRYILREFPTDPLAAAGFMLAHCGGEGRYFPIVDLIFAQQSVWTRSERPVDALLNVVKQAGFTQESFETGLPIAEPWFIVLLCSVQDQFIENTVTHYQDWKFNQAESPPKQS